MNKEIKILIISLLIIGISGIVIFAVQKNKPVETSTPEAGNLPQQNTVNTEAIFSQIKTALGQLQSQPDNRELLVTLGNMYYDLDSANTAIMYYERALKINPDDAMVLVDCGAMYRISGQADKAIDYFRKAIKLNPQLPQAYFNLGIVLHMEKGDKAGAIEAWKKYLELDPNSPIKELLNNLIQGDMGS